MILAKADGNNRSHRRVRVEFETVNAILEARSGAFGRFFVKLMKTFFS
jgi:hypothetical protein